MDTIIFYVDESGSTHRFDLPIANGQTPIFTLTGLAMPLIQWRKYDRHFNGIKAKFFPEILAAKGRKENIEIKGSEIVSPRNRDSKRRWDFLAATIRLVNCYDGKLFAVTFLKSHEKPISSKSLYTHAFQILLERFHDYLINHFKEPHQGIIICDSRSGTFRGNGLDKDVAKSHQTYIFGHSVGKTLINIKEAPLFADSKLTIGIQLADIMSAAVYSNHYHYYVRNLPGAMDYSHCQKIWPKIYALQYKNESADPKVFGFRVIDQR
jgi:hypothetical protein